MWLLLQVHVDLAYVAVMKKVRLLCRWMYWVNPINCKAVSGESRAPW